MTASPSCFPHDPSRRAIGLPVQKEFAAETALRNGSLQAAYFMMAARAFGVGCRADFAVLTRPVLIAEFFPDGQRFKSNMLCNIGHAASPEALFGASAAPRL